ncbi:hypothetical protein L3X38_002026 [Prunus dulcis]|uniref:BED zinc finger n=1 Tax=Prunus dulcis TaxID=3755 RepID=A0AAD4WT81_PRUDU|nr:hypothetical protein L3X38_002026 [Prunus dulcis]
MSGVPENNEAICSGKNGKSYHGMEEALGELAMLCAVYDYVCLSAHFIDENWKLRKWVLYFRCLWDPSVNCSEDCGIFKSLEALEIADKISTLATSNDRCYAKMFEYVKTHVQEKKELRLNGQLFNVYCFGEIISQMVEDAFRKISDLIDRVGELYSLKSLPLWYLTSSNLKQALELWSMGEFSSKDVTDSYDVPSPEEWKIVEGVCKIVDSIYEVSNALSPEEWKIVEVLDPRFKMKYVEFICSKVKGGDGSSQVAAVLGAFHKLFDDYVIRFPEKENFISESSSSDSDSEEESPPRQENHTFGVLQAYQQFIQLDNQPTQKSDLEYYLEEPVLPWSQDFNALTWWRTAGAQYPILSRMA